MKQGPYQPSYPERDHHEATGHAIYRSWCPGCIQGRGRATPHLSKDHSGDVIPVLSWDYGFRSAESAEEEARLHADASGQSPTLVMRDRMSGVNRINILCSFS